jgi:hypothetical protein
MPVLRTTSSTSGSPPHSMATQSSHLTPSNIFHLERATFYNLSDTMTLLSTSANHFQADKTEFAYSFKTYANTLQILSHPTSTTLLSVGIVTSYVMETAPPTQLASKIISLQRLVSAHLRKKCTKQMISPPPYHPLSLLQLSTFQIFPYGFTRIGLDRDLDKTDQEKEGLVSPMTPGVGKIPWHLSLYGSEVKLLLLLLLLWWHPNHVHQSHPHIIGDDACAWFGRSTRWGQDIRTD